jgi:hypothetical protein
MPFPKTLVKLFEASVHNVSLTYTQVEKAGKSQAMLTTIGQPADCPHCSAKVPANHSHACTLHRGNWTRRDTPRAEMFVCRME